MADRTDPAEALRAAKDELRSRMRAARDAIPEADRARRAEEVARLLLALPEASGVGRVFTFLSFGSEVPTAPLIAGFRARGARVAVPVLEAGRMEAVDLPAGRGARAVRLRGHGAGGTRARRTERDRPRGRAGARLRPGGPPPRLRGRVLRRVPAAAGARVPGRRHLLRRAGRGRGRRRGRPTGRSTRW